MEAYNRTKCEAHGATDCILCAMKARKDKAAPKPPAGTGPSFEPPPDIEGLSTPALTPEDVANIKTEDPIVTTIPGWTTPEFAGPASERYVKSLEALPTDDSHASQVARAAAAYAKAASRYAAALVEVEKTKGLLKIFEMKLDTEREARDKAENELKSLTNEGLYPFKDVDDAAKKRQEAILRSTAAAAAAELSGLR